MSGRNFARSAWKKYGFALDQQGTSKESAFRRMPEPTVTPGTLFKPQ